MFRKFYTTQMSANHKQLQTRFAKMRSKSGKFSKIMAAAVAMALVLTMACATIVMATIDSRNTGTEFAGAMYTYYAYPQESMEYNVNHALDIYNEKHSDALLYSNYSSVRYGYNLFERYFTPLCLAQSTRYYLIDSDGYMIDVYNRAEPYYGVIKFWRAKSNSFEDFEKKEFTTLTIADKEVTVCFADGAIAYKDDSVIRKMIENQINFELSYNSPLYDYDHNAYISEIIKNGVYVIRNVFPKEKIQSYSYFGGHYGDFTEEAIIADNVNNIALQKRRANTYFKDSVLLHKNTDGNQAVKICEATVHKDECLIIDVKNTTNKMPYINYKLIAKDGLQTYSVLSNNGATVQPSEAAEVFMMNVGGTRRNYIPYGFIGNQGITYEIWASGCETDYADIEIYTCKMPDNETDSYKEDWVKLFTYQNPYGLANFSYDENNIEWGR